jgi:hypothetical protein
MRRNSQPNIVFIFADEWPAQLSNAMDFPTMLRQTTSFVTHGWIRGEATHLPTACFKTLPELAWDALLMDEYDMWQLGLGMSKRVE